MHLVSSDARPCPAMSRLHSHNGEIEIEANPFKYAVIEVCAGDVFEVKPREIICKSLTCAFLPPFKGLLTFFLLIDSEK